MIGCDACCMTTAFLTSKWPCVILAIMLVVTVIVAGTAVGRYRGGSGRHTYAGLACVGVVLVVGGYMLFRATLEANDRQERFQDAFVANAMSALNDRKVRRDPAELQRYYVEFTVFTVARGVHQRFCEERMRREDPLLVNPNPDDWKMAFELIDRNPHAKKFPKSVRLAYLRFRKEKLRS